MGTILLGAFISLWSILAIGSALFILFGLLITLMVIIQNELYYQKPDYAYQPLRKPLRWVLYGGGGALLAWALIHIAGWVGKL